MFQFRMNYHSDKQLNKKNDTINSHITTIAKFSVNHNVTLYV